MLQEAKVEAMNSIFAAIGGGLEKIIVIMSNDEIAKSFDYFSRACAITDDEESDIATWIGFLEFAEAEFANSDKVLEFLKNWN